MNKPQHKLNVSMQLYDKLQLSAHADTHELFHGTPKYFSARVPGYSGTLAETAHVCLFFFSEQNIFLGHFWTFAFLQRVMP